jgi:glycosyltransferase involved in cell wall biosynthesis
MTPFFSIITVVFNRAKTIEAAITSLQSQSYKNYEHIIIDGGSSDGTLEILSKYKSENTVVVSEADQGIYDAINKGIGLAQGNYIGLLHSDDFYPSNTSLADVYTCLENKDFDAIYGDAKYLRAGHSSILRYYRSNDFSYQNLRYGVMLAHTTLFVKRSIFNKVGVYDNSYKIAGDFEFICRLFKENIQAYYLPKTLMMMTVGGISNANIANRILLNKELLSACNKNGIRTNYLYLSLRYFKKLLQYIKLD